MQYNLADLFECVAKTVPDRLALVCGDRRLTFKQLDERANRAAHMLLDAGVKQGYHIGLYLYNGTEYVEAALAAYKIRAVPVNINFRYVEEELRYLFTDADLTGVVYSREFAPRLAAVAPSTPMLRTFVQVDDRSGADPSGLNAIDYESTLAEESDLQDFGERSGDDLYLIYTGGTTGMPKGVMWRQEDVFFGGLQGGNVGGAPIERPEQIGEIVASREGPTMIPVAPLMHGNGFWSCMIGLLGGGKVVLHPKFDAHAIWSLVEREKINVLSIVGDAMARPLAEALNERDYDVSSAFVISSGGAIWSEAVKQQLRQHMPNILLVDAYGVSETGHQGMGIATAGSPGPRFTVDPNTAVIDDDLRPVAAGSGIVGRLARRGRMPLGYYKDETKTAATFMTDADGVRWVIPGDMATIDADGTVTLLGRGSICINSGGEKIYPEEVEAALKAHPAVFDAVVVGVPDERWGERVAAVVQPRQGHALTLEEIDAHCRTHVSGYKVPRELHLVDEVVRSPSGKADYRWAKATAMGEPPARSR
ncbi:MAG: acyl-CoA synthetase [Dehalococcoidia bacterium]